MIGHAVWTGNSSGTSGKGGIEPFAINVELFGGSTAFRVALKSEGFVRIRDRETIPVDGDLDINQN